MRIVIQRVKHASVTIEGNVKSAIQQGFLILLGIGDDDNNEDIDWLVRKVIGLRIFDDENGVMNRNIMETGGDALVVSQFTLMASYKKGNRPSYIHAAKHEIAIPLYNHFCEELSKAMGKPVGTGEFGADMKRGIAQRWSGNHLHGHEKQGVTTLTSDIKYRIKKQHSATDKPDK